MRNNLQGKLGILIQELDAFLKFRGLDKADKLAVECLFFLWELMKH
jgi:hypothetical protein